MTKVNTERPINTQEITPEDWQLYIKKLFKTIPGKGLTLQYQWLADKLGISPGTAAAWLNSGVGIPSSENQVAVAKLLKIDLIPLISQVQYRQDPPPIPSSSISQDVIEAISNIQLTEIEMTAKSLSGVTHSSLIRAASRLMQLAEILG